MRSENKENGDDGHQVDKERYFKEAREWYSAVYHYPIAGRSLYIVICLLAVTTLLIAGFTLYSLFPLNQLRPLVVYTDDPFGEIAQIERMAKPGEDFNVAIASHILPIYVQAREHYEYDVAKLEESFSIVRRQSSKEVFEEYQAFMNPKNKASPLTRYGKGIARLVTIRRYSVDVSSTPHTARIEFHTRVDDGRRVHKNRYVADIAFRFSKIRVDQSTGEAFKEDIDTGERMELDGKVNFRVTKYQVREELTKN